MPDFILVAGPNGGGKSTLTAYNACHYQDVKIIDPDQIAKIITGSFSTVAKVQGKAGKQAIRQVRECIATGKSFLVESTISGNTYLKYAKQAKESGFETTFIYSGLDSVDISIERVINRVKQGGHDIPLHDLKRRYVRSLNNLMEHIKVFDVAHIHDNTNSFRWVATYKNGLIHKKSQDIPPWARKTLGIN